VSFKRGDQLRLELLDLGIELPQQADVTIAGLSLARGQSGG